MKVFLNDLQDQGCHIEKALERFFYDEELYVQCYSKLMGSEEFELLQKKVKSQEKEDGLKVTHSLKGVLANLELTPMRELVLEIETSIKNDFWQEANLKCRELMKMKSLYKNILQES